MFDFSYLADYFSSSEYSSFFIMYDGWLQGIYMKTTYYDWSTGRDSESFGACVALEFGYCGGMWLEAYYDTDTSTSEIVATHIDFRMVFDDVDASNPDVPYDYDSWYNSAGGYFGFLAYGSSNLSYYMNQKGYTTAWRYVDSDLMSDDVQNGDEATMNTWTSLASGSNEVQTVTLEGIDKGAFELVASVAAALAAGVAALF